GAGAGSNAAGSLSVHAGFWLFPTKCSVGVPRVLLGGFHGRMPPCVPRRAGQSRARASWTSGRSCAADVTVSRAGAVAAHMGSARDRRVADGQVRDMRTEAAKRVELVFSLFDANGNGVVDSDDFDLMTERVLEAAVASDDSAKEAIRAAFRRYWTTLATELDANGDGVITVEEFRPFVLDPQRFGPTIREFAQALAALGDPDGDGFIERPLFVALMRAIGFEEENIHALFDAFGP